jgi:sugar O-acyltransferase (sialic acid O-acetyltransferase NeuD family)
VADGLYVAGAGGHAKVVVAALQAGGHEVLAAYDDRFQTGGDLLGVPVAGTIERLAELGAVRVAMAIGDNADRRKVVGRVPGAAWVSVVHPRAWVHPEVAVGGGSVIGAGAIVQPGAVLGRHTIVNTAASVDHDARLEDFVHVGPGARIGGGVQIGEGAWIGIGATVIHGIKIGAWTIVGAGAVVIRDQDAGVTVVGVPARVVKPRNQP